MTFRIGTAAALAVATTLAAPAAAHATGYDEAVLADNPLTYLRMEQAPGGIVPDASPNGRHGTLTGMAAIVPEGPFTAAGNAAKLGFGDTVDGAVGARSGSVEMWVNPGRLRRGEQAGFMAHGDPAADGWALGVGAKRKLAFVTAGKAIRSKVSLPANAWSMLTVSWVDGKVTFAVNGGATTKQSVLATVPASQDGGMVLGGDARGAFAGRFQGRMDEVALFAQPLTAVDAQQHFAAAQVPVNTTPVVIDGTPVVGSPIGVQPGQWTGAMSEPTYQWQRCDAAGDDCDDIPGATMSYYIVTAQDACSTLRVVEIRSNANGTTTTVSEPSAVIQGTCPGDTTGGETGGGTGGGDTGTGSAGTGTSGSGTSTDGTGTSGTDSTGTGASGIGSLDPAAPAGTASAGAAISATGAAGIRASAVKATCLKMVGGRRTVKLRRLGTLRVRFAANGCIKPGAPMRLSFTKVKGKTVSVKYRFAGKALKVSKRRGYVVKVTSMRVRAGAQTLKVRIAPRGGKARTTTLKLRFAKA